MGGSSHHSAGPMEVARCLYLQARLAVQPQSLGVPLVLLGLAQLQL